MTESVLLLLLCVSLVLLCRAVHSLFLISHSDSKRILDDYSMFGVSTVAFEVM
ncbi:hypothetical protein EXN66_Car015634 [Channa argus]|uniref:Uncharacterized protein n=1 Tax=Channa argus TaxID=215402 RepID=A0A6G1QBT9_CHAAH|nr:hypothetical protein EXN66_Car015634 [Channa argus]